jgi:hypothetical protein
MELNRACVVIDGNADQSSSLLGGAIFHSGLSTEKISVDNYLAYGISIKKTICILKNTSKLNTNIIQNFFFITKLFSGDERKTAIWTQQKERLN